MGRPLGRLLVTSLAALLCAACSGGHSSTPGGAAGGHGSAAGTAGSVAGTAQATAPGSGGGGAASVRGAAASAPPVAGAAPPAHPAVAAGPPAAAPGTYAATGSSSTSSTTQPSPSQSSGAGTLTISAPQATASGSEEDQTYRFGGSSLLTHDVYAADGSVLVSRSGSASFTPPLPIVPAGLHDGMSWGPVSFTSGGASGTFSGTAGTTTHATLGGVVVTVVPITLHLQLDGSYKGAQYSATAVESLSWAPSLHLAVHVHMTTDARYAAAGTYHSDIDVSLLSTKPQ